MTAKGVSPHDLRSGQRIEAEVKVLFLGNGGVGKTQLCRWLRDLEFDPSVPITHGIQLSEMTFGLDGFQEPVRLNLWDFGGQEIYHGSHALFLQVKGRPFFSYSGRRRWSTKPPTRRVHSFFVTAPFPTGSITSAPLPVQMLPY
jgi:GTPase SAR1 family protein